MVYVDFQDMKLSQLGFGAMRLPTVDGQDAHIDEAAARQMVDEAMTAGVNYFDTAWGYHGGQSEVVMGKLLDRYPRSSYYLADKFPGYDLGNMDHVERIFEEQLRRCGVDYFDFYLLHNVCELNIDAYLDPEHGILDYLLRQQAAGRIRHLGFSAHGSREVMERFLDAYGEHMEFGQLQLNYLDWSFQGAKQKAALLGERGIPVWVMEPLRGGRLANLSEAEMAPLRALRPKETAASWAYRFLQTVPNVAVVLSGASSIEQMRDNIRLFSDERPLSEAEMGTLLGVAEGMTKGIALPCTACRYCVDHCPRGLDIPALLNLYNEHCFTGGGFIAPMALSALPREKQPSACVGCKACEAVCPQRIGIADAMADFAWKLNG